jgi:hypothetical protein
LEQPQKGKLDSSAALERLFKRWPRERDNISFEEALGLLDEVELALDSARDNPDLHRDLSNIRNGLVERLDARARELGTTEKWEALKKGRSVLNTMDNLLKANDGAEFFDTFRDVAPEQRDALEKEVDLKEVRRLEPLADAMRQDSPPKVFLGLLQTNPFAAVKLTARYFWPSVLLVLSGSVLFWQGYRALAGLLIVVGVIHALRVALK